MFHPVPNSPAPAPQRAEASPGPIPPAPSWTEAERLAALGRYDILDTPPEQAFDDVARLAAQICGTPISAVTLLTGDRQWFKASVGLGMRETARDVSLCTHALAGPGDPLVVPDATLDARFRDNPLVVGPLGLRFYAGARLDTPEGLPLGTLCVIDTAPRALDEGQLFALRTLAGQVMAQLELRRALAERDRALEQMRGMTGGLERLVEARTADIARERARLEGVLAALPVGVMLIDAPGGAVSFVNPRAEALVRHEVRGDGVADFETGFGALHPDGSAFAPGDYPAVRALASGGTVGPEDVRYRRGDGAEAVFSVVAAPVRDASGALMSVVTVFDDVSDRRATEDALRQAQKMEAIGQLTGGIAHDFNNLLTGIVGSLDLMGRRIGEGRPEAANRYIAGAVASAQRGAALTHRLLAFARRQPLDPRPVDTGRLLFSLEELFRRSLSEAVTLELEADEALWPALCDHNQLENALLHLVLNARDAMPGGGRLAVAASNLRLGPDEAAAHGGAPAGDYVLLRVSDDGLGMDQAVMSRAFDPFFTTKPAGHGTGLGLSMVYGFVRQSGGRIRLRSVPGRGTTVDLLLPRHRVQAEAVPAAASDPAAATAERGGGEGVLVVEDQAVVRALVVEVLDELGYGALEAPDARDALRQLRGGAAVDVLVTDIGLPGGMNGRELADAARVLRPGLKVLFITGYAETDVLGSDELEPGTELLCKPFSMEVLSGRLRHILGDGAVPPDAPPLP